MTILRELNPLLDMEKGLKGLAGCLGLGTCSSQLEWVNIYFENMKMNKY